MAARRGRARREPPGEREGPKRAAKTMDSPPLLKGGKKRKKRLAIACFLGRTVVYWW